MDLKQELQKIGIFLNDAVIDYINQYCDNEIVRAKEKQREKDISSAVCAFVELKRTDSEIYQLLNKHFCVENISEAQDYIKNARIHKHAGDFPLEKAKGYKMQGQFWEVQGAQS